LPPAKGDVEKSVVYNMAVYLKMGSHTESIVSQWTWIWSGYE